MAENQRLYSLRKSRQILRTSYAWYKKKGKNLNPDQLNTLKNDLAQLDQAIRNEDRGTADTLAHKLESFGAIHFKKSFFDYISELLIALVLALIVATIVRQMWFELYEIPTGSMRPTFFEQDHLTVSKLAFGINVPLRTEHFYFDPKLVQRTSICIFSGADMPYIDQDTTYFYVIPYKKRYIKRCMGKPGDIVYFYGGKIYTLDKDDNFISELLDSPYLHNIEHVPFLTFEGQVTAPVYDQIVFHQMNLPVGKLSISSSGTMKGEVFNGKEWVKDQPGALKTAHSEIQTYSDLWGIRNFAMARLLTKQQLEQDPNIDTEGLEKGVLYLELRHTPSLTYPKPKFQQDRRGTMVLLAPYTTIIPLQQQHLDAIMDNMYTARFVVDDGRGRRYSLDEQHFSPRSPRFQGVPNGTYEFYFGKAVKVGWGGITSDVLKDSPLYSRDPANIQKLYNMGIEMDTAFSPSGGQQNHYPQRYAYFRNGDLYLLGAPVMKKDDPILVDFNTREQKREQNSSQSRPYVAFKDYGPPLKSDGQVDKDFIHTFGLKVTDNHYLALGDNHAMSSDSRVFGFVPQNNLQGAPSLIIWPPGDRLGPPMQKPYPIINLPRLVIWGIALLIALIWYGIHRYNMRKPLKL